MMSSEWKSQKQEQFYKSVGEKLREIRESHGMSQLHITQILGFKSPATISHYETGARKITLLQLLSLASLFNIQVDDLLPKKSTLANYQQEKIVIDDGNVIVSIDHGFGVCFEDIGDGHFVTVLFGDIGRVIEFLEQMKPDTRQGR